MELKLRTFTKGNSVIKLFGIKNNWDSDSDLVNTVYAWTDEIKKLKSNGYSQKIEKFEIKKIDVDAKIENYFK